LKLDLGLATFGHQEVNNVPGRRLAEELSVLSFLIGDVVALDLVDKISGRKS
jgi:hypothetical protein